MEAKWLKAKLGMFGIKEGALLDNRAAQFFSGRDKPKSADQG